MQIFVVPVTEIVWNCLGVAESNIWPAVFKPQGMEEVVKIQCYSQSLYIDNNFLSRIQNHIILTHLPVKQMNII